MRLFWGKIVLGNWDPLSWKEGWLKGGRKKLSIMEQAAF